MVDNQQQLHAMGLYGISINYQHIIIVVNNHNERLSNNNLDIQLFGNERSLITIIC